MDCLECTIRFRTCQWSFLGGARCAAVMWATISYNGLRVYEPARRAQAVAPLLLCNRRDRRAGCRRPRDDRRAERSVKPLLGAFVGHILSCGPATDGRAANHSFSKNNSRQTDHLAGISYGVDMMPPLSGSDGSVRFSTSISSACFLNGFRGAVMPQKS